jgi:hypothetical protein
VRHTKQFHSPSQVLDELTPTFPQAQAYLYRDEDYALAALEHLRFRHVILKDSRLSNSTWATYSCSEFALIFEILAEGVHTITLMGKTVDSLEHLDQCLAKAGVMGERLRTWHPSSRVAPSQSAIMQKVDDGKRAVA